MAITIRDLLARVHQFRPDLLEGQSLWALQEAARDVAKYAGICQVVQVPAPVYAGTVSQVWQKPTGSDDTIIRIIRVRFPSLPENLTLGGAQFLSMWNASTNTPAVATGGATSANLYCFYICSVAGSQTIDSETTFAVGDVLYSTGTEWKKIRLEQYRTSTESNRPSLNLCTPAPQGSLGFPNYWTQEQGTLFFYSVPKFDIPCELTFSVVPSRNQLVDDAAPWTFPMEVEECLVYGALDLLMRLPGDGQSLQQAESWRIRYMRERANVRTIAVMGNGSAWYQPANFTGRQGRLTPGWL